MSAPEQSAAARDEVQVVERARAGYLEAFEELLGCHQQRVMGVVLSILKEPMDAEEVAQDVFLTVFEKIDHFRGDISRWISPTGRSRLATQFWPGRPGR